MRNQAIIASIPMNTAVTGSRPIKVGNLEGFSVQANWSALSAGVTGSLYLQSSLDWVEPNTPDSQVSSYITNWATIPGSTYSVNTSSGSTGTYLWDVDRPHYPWMRMVYSGSAGSGSLSARAMGTPRK